MSIAAIVDVPSLISATQQNAVTHVITHDRDVPAHLPLAYHPGSPNSLNLIAAGDIGASDLRWSLIRSGSLIDVYHGSVEPKTVSDLLVDRWYRYPLRIGALRKSCLPFNRVTRTKYSDRFPGRDGGVVSDRTSELRLTISRGALMGNKPVRIGKCLASFCGKGRKVKGLYVPNTHQSKRCKRKRKRKIQGYYVGTPWERNFKYL